MNRLSVVKRCLKHCEVKVVPAIALALLESGEAAGTLGESLQYISRHYDWERQVRQKVISAISYPLFLLVLMNIFSCYHLVYRSIPLKRFYYHAYYITSDDTSPLCIRTRAKESSHSGCYSALCRPRAMIFAYHQQSIKRKVHRWFWQLAHRYQWMTCIYYTSMLKVWALCWILEFLLFTL